MTLNESVLSDAFCKPEVVPLDWPCQLRNWVGWVFIIGTCVLCGPPFILLMALLRPFGLASRWGDFTVSWWLGFLRWLWRVEVIVEGLEHIEAGKTYVLVANHRSHLDAVACFRALCGKLRFAFIVKRSLALIPIWGWFIWLNDYVPIDRERGGRANRDQLSTAVTYLQRGRSVLIFPEGTRAADHRFRPLKKGAAQLALRAGVPLLPVVISGTGRLWPRDSLYVRSGKVRIDVRPPISVEGRGLSARDEVMQEIKASLVEPYRLSVEGAALRDQPDTLALIAPR